MKDKTGLKEQKVASNILKSGSSL